MVPSPLHKTLTQDKKEMLRHKRPLPYSTPEKPKNPKPKHKPRPKEVEMLQELLLFLPRSVVITNEEMSSLYRILEGLG